MLRAAPRIPGCFADALDDLRVRRVARVTDFRDSDLNLPVVSVIEEVSDPLALLEAQLAERRARAFPALLELEGAAYSVSGPSQIEDFAQLLRTACSSR